MTAEVVEADLPGHWIGGVGLPEKSEPCCGDAAGFLFSGALVRGKVC